MGGIGNTVNWMGRSGRTAQRVVDAYAENPDASMRQIAEQVGTTLNYVRCVRQRRRCNLPRKVRVAESSHRANATPSRKGSGS